MTTFASGAEKRHYYITQHLPTVLAEAVLDLDRQLDGRLKAHMDYSNSDEAVVFLPADVSVAPFRATLEEMTHTPFCLRLGIDAENGQPFLSVSDYVHALEFAPARQAIHALHLAADDCELIPKVKRYFTNLAEATEAVQRFVASWDRRRRPKG